VSCGRRRRTLQRCGDLPGPTIIRVSKEGFVSEERQVQISGDMTVDFDLKANQ